MQLKQYPEATRFETLYKLFEWKLYLKPNGLNLKSNFGPRCVVIKLISTDKHLRGCGIQILCKFYIIVHKELITIPRRVCLRPDRYPAELREPSLDTLAGDNRF